MQTNAAYIGRSVLVGIRHLDADGNETAFVDFFGIVEKSDDRAGVLLRRSDGQTYNLPPIDLDDYPPNHSSYGIQSQPERVTPDFVVTFDVHPPKKN
ncbi:MAG: hypothetical protein JO256_10050 [Alphaproteobacteria bacterium]|nr:hypothetical protein [Alphaproteobacteria bacterium]